MKAEPNCTPPFFTDTDASTVHGDLSAGLGGSSFALVIALSGEKYHPWLGALLYKMGKIRGGNTTTATHKNQHEPLPPYPPAALALSLHG